MGSLLMRTRLSLAWLCLLSLQGFATGQGLSPEEAVRRMKLPDGFSVRCVASEPMIRQPVSISFDHRGRLWVLQYLQYPNYAGLKPLRQDQYLRTIWDRIPEPPPKGPKGADKITILYDPDEHGVFRRSKDFLTGLNIASGFCLGRGGVYVAQPPYLLFYADKDEDDVPDGDPEVLLSGFGMDDTHSLANSLQWGPDGWLYGAAGSTSTSRISNPNHPKDPVVEFQQGIWRFHPRTKKFELFSEGGGNTYGLDFDRHGQAIAGTNQGGSACLHQVQGAYFVKAFAKHGPLHNPHTYGYFDHVPYTGFRGGHVTCGGIVYQADTYPAEYRDQYIAANLLSNTIDWHKLEPDLSSFRASRGGELLGANDPWFRPVDCLQGPDGCVYVVDFYDRRAAHLDPVDNWDKTNGRIYRIEYNGGPKYPTFDLREKSTAELLELLKHPNVWWRREARQLLAERAERGDRSGDERLRQWVSTGTGSLALEALWTAYVTGAADAEFLRRSLSHSEERVREWAVRLLTDHGPAAAAAEWVGKLDPRQTSAPVLAQIACSARRVPVEQVPQLIRYLIQNPATRADPRMPLLIWWAIEDEMTRTRGWKAAEEVMRVEWSDDLIRGLVEKIARRWTAGDIQGGDHVFVRVFTAHHEHNYSLLLRGLAQGLDLRGDRPLPDQVLAAMRKCRDDRPDDPLLTEVLARVGDETARQSLWDTVLNVRIDDPVRVQALGVLTRVRDSRLPKIAREQLPHAKSPSLLAAYLAGLERFADPTIAEFVLSAYPAWPAVVKQRAVQMLLTRPEWALELFQRLDTGRFPKSDVSIDQARAAVALGDRAVTALVEKHFGKVAPATAGEKQARIAWLNAQIPREKDADAARGKVLYTRLCAGCHRLHGEGGQVGPDLTNADRKNRGYLLAQIVDPSGYIRPEYVVQTILTTDERKLAGVAREVGDAIELTNYVDDKAVVVRVAKSDIAEIRPSANSLMPEKILDSLTDSQIADLFAYLMSDAPNPPAGPPAPAPSPGPGVGPAGPGVGPAGPGSPPPAPRLTAQTGENRAEPRKLRLVFVSGSFEYKSDTTLTEFKKRIEENYPVEVVIISAKAEKDTSLPGLAPALEKCDLAVFFTRRLQIEGESLDAVKKYVASHKPVVGIRTASHGFQRWLEMDKEVFGGDYRGHYGPGVASIKPVETQKNHPVLNGVAAFETNGSLYKNPAVASDVTVLLHGTVGTAREPVAWVREKDGRRVFYTSLGHPDDFRNENFIRLLVNGIAWAARADWKR